MLSLHFSLLFHKYSTQNHSFNLDHMMRNSKQKMSDDYYFPEEILIRILTRLPVKSLCRFAVVSKSWHALITSPTFISTHLHHTLNDIASNGKESIVLRGDESKCYTFLRCKNETDKTDLFEFPTLELNFPFDGRFRVVGSSNGLLCLVTELSDGAEKVVLWNPSIRRSLVLPRPTIEPAFRECHIDVYGFGVADGDFKVVRIVFPDINHFSRLQSQVEVYSLNRGAWKRAKQPDFRCTTRSDFYKSQVLVNGRSHWLTYRMGENGFQEVILAFDMSDELFREIMLPDALSSVHRYGGEDHVELCCNLSVESLTLIRCRNRSSCCIWIMKEYGVVESWTRIYSFCLIGEMVRVVGVWRDGEVLVARYLNGLVLYDVKTRTTKAIGNFESPSSFYIDRYMESLILLRE